MLVLAFVELQPLLFSGMFKIRIVPMLRADFWTWLLAAEGAYRVACLGRRRCWLSGSFLADIFKRIGKTGYHRICRADGV